jgi:hypothetical protein
MMSLRDLIGTVMGLWLLSVIACIVSFRWAIFSLPRRFWPAVALSAFALIGGYLGMTHFRVVASRTVNGRVQWKFDSKYFFITTMVLAALALAVTVWRQKKLRSSATGT